MSPWPTQRGACSTPRRRGRRRVRSLLRRAERRGVLLEQLDDGTRAGLVGEPDGDALAVGGAHAGDAARLPIALPEHVADHRDLLHHGLVHPVRLEARAVTARAKEPLRKESAAAIRAAPDAYARSHSMRSRMAAAAVPP